MTQEQKARVSSDALLKQTGWYVFIRAVANIHTVGSQYELTCKVGDGFSDYLRAHFVKLINMHEHFNKRNLKKSDFKGGR